MPVSPMSMGSYGSPAEPLAGQARAIQFPVIPADRQLQQVKATKEQVNEAKPAPEAESKAAPAPDAAAADQVKAPE